MLRVGLAGTSEIGRCGSTVIGLLIADMKKQTDLPTPEEFIAFWRAAIAGSWRDALPHVLYMSGLVLYAVIVGAALKYHPGVVEWFLGFAFAIVYIVVLPWTWMLFVWKRDARFIRCPQCGDWLGRDASGAWSGPNPKWKSVCQTGTCGRCGRRLLAAT